MAVPPVVSAMSSSGPRARFSREKRPRPLWELHFACLAVTLTAFLAPAPSASLRSGYLPIAPAFPLISVVVISGTETPFRQEIRQVPPDRQRPVFPPPSSIPGELTYAY